MSEWILWGLNVAVLVFPIALAARILRGRRIRRRELERGLDHLAEGGPYATFDRNHGPLEVQTQDGMILGSWPLPCGGARALHATKVLADYGWHKSGQVLVFAADTFFVPVTHRPLIDHDARKVEES
ncbi:hypothetical protein ACFTWF_34835 [Rhodococcus sp. NPDC056960]|uniref:hypothetical protein n=1 Tax=Rhodococcus sp. NPDC056960 TaxID=3345982 RepID=UPI0036364F4E